MKTLTPDYELLQLETTPDYSPRVPKVRLPSYIRENGRQLAQHRLVRAPWGSDLNFYQSLIVPLSPAEDGLIQHLLFNVEREQIEPIEIDDADLVLMDDGDWGEIPPKASFPVRLCVTKVERGQIEPIEIDDADLVIFDF